jgi:hypothetical protein
MGMRLIVYVRMNDGNAVDNMAVVEEADVRIVEREDHNQNTTDYLLTFL